ncbi:WD repeat-containing protein 75 [Geodia barretti]|uniref:WD repeat-containing protein 75 n=1 Tax=Geodia barretti TaxID=519541 RepID=A0AA35R4H2_GEOBA|nr:WD repeat-containing protein 75 [Geodia barretti]
MRTGLVWDPRSLSFVTNSNSGSLQWYRPDLDQVTCQLDVTGLNYVSRRDEPLVLMTVEHAAFSSDGHWLATIEWRDDGKTTPELRLKFWQFTASSQEFELNTCVEPPHNGKVTSLSFQPPPPPPRNSLSSSTSLAGKSTGSAPPLAAVSTSEDGNVKTWVLLGGAEERGGDASWACRSVAYYQCLPCRGACFSRDGSLLATNFKKCLTLWDPYTCELRKVFSSPFPPETFSQHTFGSKTSSHYLISTTDRHLIVWDLLRCSVLWSVAVDVAVLVADPVAPMAAAFVPSKQGTTHLYVFDPSSPAPVNVWESVCSEPVTSAAYAHATSPARESRGGGGEERTSKLYFQTSSQVLYQVSNEGEDHPVINTAKEGEVVMQKGREEQSRQAFFEVFGKATKGAVEPNTASSVNHSVRLRGKLKVWDTAPHALPPLTSLAPLFLGSLLPSKRPGSSRGEMEDLESDGEEEERDSVEGEDSDSGAQERDSHRRRSPWVQ